MTMMTVRRWPQSRGYHLIVIIVVVRERVREGQHWHVVVSAPSSGTDGRTALARWRPRQGEGERGTEGWRWHVIAVVIVLALP